MPKFLTNKEIVRYAQGFWKGFIEKHKDQKFEEIEAKKKSLQYQETYINSHMKDPVMQTFEEHNVDFLNIFAMGYLEGRWETMSREAEIERMEQEYNTNLDHFGTIIPRDQGMVFSVQYKDIENLWNEHQKSVPHYPTWNELTVDERRDTIGNYVRNLEVNLKNHTFTLFQEYEAHMYSSKLKTGFPNREPQEKVEEPEKIPTFNNKRKYDRHDPTLLVQGSGITVAQIIREWLGNWEELTGEMQEQYLGSIQEQILEFNITAESLIPSGICYQTWQGLRDEFEELLDRERDA